MGDWPVAPGRWIAGGSLDTGCESMASHDVLCAANASANGGLNNTGTWPAANRAIYIPFEIHTPIIVCKLGWVNAAVLTGNADAGIYDVNGNRLVSTGNTARAGATAAQTVDVADTWLMPGVHHYALVCASASGTFFRGGVGCAQLMQASGITHEGLGSAVLPATTTFPSTGGAYIPYAYIAFNAAVA